MRRHELRMPSHIRWFSCGKETTKPPRGGSCGGQGPPSEVHPRGTNKSGSCDFHRLDSQSLVFKSRRRVLVVLVVPACIRRARVQRVETHVRSRVRISREFHNDNANVRIHGDVFSGIGVEWA
jgi:hypothetical protein